MSIVGAFDVDRRPLTFDYLDTVTDKADARHLRVHLAAGDLPECWIPPEHVLEARAGVRLYKDLLDERGDWHQRIAATLFHQGAALAGSVATAAGRAAAGQADLSPAGRQAVETGLRQIDRLTGELDPLRGQLGMLSRRQPGCPACAPPSSVSARSPR